MAWLEVPATCTMAPAPCRLEEERLRLEAEEKARKKALRKAKREAALKKKNG